MPADHPECHDDSMPPDSLATSISHYGDDDDAVDRALHTDPYSVAQKLTGSSLDDDEETTRLAMMLHAEHAQAKEAILRANDDTYFGILYPEFVRVIEEAGFVEAQTRENLYDRFGMYETLKHGVYVHPLGMVLTFTTWMGSEGEKINDGEVYYNWRANDAYRAAQAEADRLGGLIAEAEEAGDQQTAAEYRRQYRKALPPDVTSSYTCVNSDPSVPPTLPNPDYDPSYEYGGEHYDPEIPYDDPRRSRELPNPAYKPEQLVLVGDHDVREGLIHNLRQLFAHGDFLAPWVAVPSGLYTFTFDERDAYYQDILHPHTPEARERWETLTQAQRSQECVRRGLEGYARLAEDVERWPQAMREIIGEQAIAHYLSESKRHASHGL